MVTIYKDVLQLQVQHVLHATHNFMIPPQYQQLLVLVNCLLKTYITQQIHLFHFQVGNIHLAHYQQFQLWQYLPWLGYNYLLPVNLLNWFIWHNHIMDFDVVYYSMHHHVAITLACILLLIILIAIQYKMFQQQIHNIITYNGYTLVHLYNLVNLSFD